MRCPELVIAQLAVAIAAAVFVAPLSAQTGPDAPPRPEARPPTLAPLDDSLEPQVTIRKREGATIEEFRVRGKLYKITVTPDNGVPYTLVDQRGDGNFSPIEAPGTPALSVPMWVIRTF